MSFLSAMTPTQLVLIVAAVLGVLASIGVILVPDRHARVRSRIDAMQHDDEEQAAEPDIDLIGQQLGALGRKIAASPLIGEKEQAKMIGLLGSAGIGGKDHLAAFIAGKLTLAVIFAVTLSALLYVFGIFQSNFIYRLAVIVGGTLLGWRLPDMVISTIGNRRRARLRDGISDALDLLVICTEAGLGLEQSMDRVSRDIEIANPVVAHELRVTVAEMRVLPQMRDALDNFARRSNLPIIRSVMTTLIQSIQYGTPLAHSLRILSAEMRTHRILQIEARAARLPVLLTIPLILFILPCLFLIVAGPAMMNVALTVKHM